MSRFLTASFRSSLRTVSYTHLDVYKRQVYTHEKRKIEAYNDSGHCTTYVGHNIQKHTEMCIRDR